MWLGSIQLVVIMLWVCLDVFSRRAFDHPIEGAADISAAFLPSITFLWAPYALLLDGMLTATVLVDKLPSTIRVVMGRFASLLAFSVFAAATVAAFQPTLESWRIREFLGTPGGFQIPAYPTRAVILFGSALMTLIYGYRLVRGKPPTQTQLEL
jgi:TRAP-type C4-dicarboxylate transport system permease small subunit